MKLSRTIAYGVHATIQLARATPGVPVPCSQLARDGQMPERFLVQILRSLVTHGLLKSTCGVAGGYYLSRQPELITLLDIVEAFDNLLEINLPAIDCIAEDPRSHIVKTLQDAAAAARVELKKLTLAQLIRITSQPGDIGTGTRRKLSAEIGLPLIEPNEYDAQAGDSAVIH